MFPCRRLGAQSLRSGSPELCNRNRSLIPEHSRPKRNLTPICGCLPQPAPTHPLPVSLDSLGASCWWSRSGCGLCARVSLSVGSSGPCTPWLRGPRALCARSPARGTGPARRPRLGRLVGLAAGRDAVVVGVFLEPVIAVPALSWEPRPFESCTCCPWGPPSPGSAPRGRGHTACCGGCVDHCSPGVWAPGLCSVLEGPPWASLVPPSSALLWETPVGVSGRGPGGSPPQ